MQQVSVIQPRETRRSTLPPAPTTTSGSINWSTPSILAAQKFYWPPLVEYIATTLLRSILTLITTMVVMVLFPPLPRITRFIASVGVRVQQLVLALVPWKVSWDLAP